MVYSIMMWTTSSYLKAMKKRGSAILHGKVCYYPIDKLRSVIVKNKKDFKIVESIIKANASGDYGIKYDKLS